jgi:hypothetical protein
MAGDRRTVPPSSAYSPSRVECSRGCGCAPPPSGCGCRPSAWGVASCLVACPALVPALSLDLLPDNRVVLCANKRVAPPVGWAKDLQQLALDGIDVLQPRFQRVRVLMPRPHDEPPALQRNSPDASQATPAPLIGGSSSALSHRCGWDAILLGPQPGRALVQPRGCSRGGGPGAAISV